MRGNFRTVLCCSALALSGEALAQARADTPAEAAAKLAVAKEICPSTAPVSDWKKHPIGNELVKADAETAKKIAEVEDTALRSKLTEQREESISARELWRSALLAAEAACTTAKAAQQDLQRHLLLQATVPAADANDEMRRQAILVRLTSDVETKTDSQHKLEQAVKPAWARYSDESFLLSSYLRGSDQKLAGADTSKPAPADQAFSWSAYDIFTDPNRFLRPQFSEPATSSKLKDNEQSIADKDLSTTLARRAASRVGAFLFDRPIDRRTSGFSLEIGSEDSRVGVQFARSTLGKFLLLPTKEEEKPYRGDSPYLNTWSLGFSARADGADAIFTGGEDGGWLDDLKATFGFTRTYYRNRTWQGMREDLTNAETAAKAACKKAKRDVGEHVEQFELEAACSGESLRAWVLAGKAGGSFANADTHESVTNAVWGRAQPVMDIGINLEVGRRAFKYRNLASTDPADIDLTAPFDRVERKETRWPLLASAHVGFFGKVGDADEPQLYGALLTELGREDEVPKASRKQTICPVEPTAPNYTQCDAFDIAPPTRETFWRVGVQGKMLLAGWSSIPRIGIAPKFTFDVKSDEFALDVPITFVESSDGKLSAGVRFKKEWEGPDPDPFSFGIFLGKAFSIGN